MSAGNLHPVLQTRSADAFFDAYDAFWGAGWDLATISPERLKLLYLCHHLAVSIARDIALLLTEDGDDEVVRALPTLITWCRSIHAPMASRLLADLPGLLPGRRIPRGDVARWRAVDRLLERAPSPFEPLQRRVPQVRTQLATALRRYLRAHRPAVEAEFRAAVSPDPEVPRLDQLARIRPASLFADQFLQWLAAKAPYRRQTPRGRALWSLLGLRSSLRAGGTMHFWESGEVSTRLDLVLEWTRELPAPKTKAYLRFLIQALPGKPPRHERSRLALLRRLEAGSPVGDPFLDLDRRHSAGVIAEIPKVVQAYVREHASSMEADYISDVG